MQEGIIPLVFVEVVIQDVGDFLTKNAVVHVSVKLINYNQILAFSYKFIMRYNELTYHKANPFYKQDFLPDRAWYNRKPKEFPSQIPSGQDYFVDSGRKHYANKFNHSEIAEDSILKSPERYPFQNRIALEKGYMRNLDTIDIEGAASGTRMNQSIKNKYKAQQDLARRYNQSLNMKEVKEKTYEQKRRQIAHKQYQTLQERKQRQINDRTQALQNSRISQQNKNMPQQEPLNHQTVIESYGNYRQNGNKYIDLKPRPYYAHLESNRQMENNPTLSELSNQYQQVKMQLSNSERQSSVPLQVESKRKQAYERQNVERSNNNSGNQYEVPTNNRFKSNPQYINGFDSEWQKRKEEYLRNVQIDEYSKNKLQDKKQFRKYNPTNLSLNLAAQSIVANMH